MALPLMECLYDSLNFIEDRFRPSKSEIIYVQVGGYEYAKLCCLYLYYYIRRIADLCK